MNFSMSHLQELYQNFMIGYSYYVIAVLMIIVFRLGFAQRLPFLKNLVVYTVLLLGCFPITFLYALGMPVDIALVITAIVLTIVRIRQRNYNPTGKDQRSEANGS